MLPLLAHEVRPCLIYGEAVLEVGQGLRLPLVARPASRKISLARY
jgi:hypothetical protein